MTEQESVKGKSAIAESKRQVDRAHLLLGMLKKRYEETKMEWEMAIQDGAQEEVININTELREICTVTELCRGFIKRKLAELSQNVSYYKKQIPN